MTDSSIREEVRRRFEEALEARRQIHLVQKQRFEEERRAAEQRLRRAQAHEAWVTCLAALVFLGLVVWGAWWMLAGISDWLHTPVQTRPTTATSHSPRPAPVWKPEATGDAATLKNTTLWTDMKDAADLRLLDHIGADDIHSIDRDYLDDNKGLTSADVEITIVREPEHGTLEPQADKGQAVYTPRPGFSGHDSFDYTVKLHNQPEVQKIEYRIEVGLSPGAQYRLEHKYENCAAARAAGAAPVRRGEEAYGRHLDADMDGIGCE